MAIAEYPNDTEAREKLALLYAEQLDRLRSPWISSNNGRPDRRHSQANSSLAGTSCHPAHPPRQRHQLAAENALRRIIDRFPKSAVATQALGRLATLQGELKAAATVTAAKVLGVYEKDMGLKAGPGSPRNWP